MQIDESSSMWCDLCGERMAEKTIPFYGFQAKSCQLCADLHQHNGETIKQYTQQSQNVT